MADTAELLALELGKLLEPLQVRLEAGELAELFEDLGLPLPHVVRDAQGVVTAAGQTVAALRLKLMRWRVLPCLPFR